MTDYEKSKVIDIVEGFDDTELKIILNIIPEALLWEELRTRSENKTEVINNIIGNINDRVRINGEV